ncbi:hypothetical protein LZ30DRAFT_692968 [Colletotrichum cereale]|nr:hypothetical protein LZ30DRAFT_692968 [Colletotrichum cereale]
MQFATLTQLAFTAALVGAIPTEMDGQSPASKLVSRVSGTWEAHAKYYALGGATGNEVYLQGTWTNPVAAVGQVSGTCTAKIGGITTDSDPIFEGCEFLELGGILKPVIAAISLNEEHVVNRKRP